MSLEIKRKYQEAMGARKLSQVECRADWEKVPRSDPSMRNMRMVIWCSLLLPSSFLCLNYMRLFQCFHFQGSVFQNLSVVSCQYRSLDLYIWSPTLYRLGYLGLLLGVCCFLGSSTDSHTKTGNLVIGWNLI